MILNKLEVTIKNEDNSEKIVYIYHDIDESVIELVEEWYNNTNDYHPENLSRFLFKRTKRTVFTENRLKKFRKKNDKAKCKNKSDEDQS